MDSFYAYFVPHAVALLVHLVGLVVAIVLLIRAKGTAAILAVVGFALLTLNSVGQIVLRLPAMWRQLFRLGQWSTWFSSCCCGLFDMIAVACLIVALWQAISATSAEKAAEGAGATWEEEAESIE